MSKNTKRITLEQIASMKEAKRKEIELQKERLTDAAQAIFAPMKPAATKAESMINLFNKGMAAYDGIMLGMKVISSFKSFFRRRKRRKR